MRHQTQEERGADLNGEGNHAPHAIGEAGHGLAHPLGVADDHQLGALQPVLIAQQGILEPHTACNTAPSVGPAQLHIAQCLKPGP